MVISANRAFHVISFNFSGQYPPEKGGEERSGEKVYVLVYGCNYSRKEGL